MLFRVFGVMGIWLFAACVDTAPSGVASASKQPEPWADAGSTKRPPFAPSAPAARDAAISDAADAAMGMRAPPSTETTSASAGAPVSPLGSHDAGGAAAPPPSTASDAGVEQAQLEPGALVISELMIDPKTLSDAEGEWIELYNPSPRSISLQGCELDDGGKTPREWMPSLRIEPGAYATIARSADAGFTPDAIAAISLTNSADSLALRCAGVEIDRVSYSKAAGYPLMSGASLALDPARLDASANDEAGAWCAAQHSYGPELGSPGQANPPCHPDAAVDAGVTGTDDVPGEPEPE